MNKNRNVYWMMKIAHRREVIQEIKAGVLMKHKEERHERPEITGFCLNCGTEIEVLPGHRKKKFCSDKCRLSWWNQNMDKVNRKANYVLTCQFCGKEFYAYAKKDKKYCSRECFFMARKLGRL